MARPTNKFLLAVLGMTAFGIVVFRTNSDALRRVAFGHNEEIVPEHNWTEAYEGGHKYKVYQGLSLIKHSIYDMPYNATDMDLFHLYHKFINTIEITCAVSLRVGHGGDGGWNVCNVFPYTIKPKCLVYDFGLGKRWGFNDQMSNRFKCKVRGFDPTIFNMDKEVKRTELNFFYPLGLHGHNHMLKIRQFKCQMKTLGTLLKRFGEENTTLDYLKIDIEQSEWAALTNILAEGRLKHVKQIGIELHSGAHLYRKWIPIMKELYDQGFRRWNVRLNKVHGRHHPIFGAPVVLHEAHYLNINFLKSADLG